MSENDQQPPVAPNDPDQHTEPAQEIPPATNEDVTPVPDPSEQEEPQDIRWTPSLEELEQILEEHEIWLETDSKAGRRAIFRKVNLQEKDLSNAKLKKARFWKADLRKAYFIGAELQETSFEETNLQEANLLGAKLQKAKLLGIDLQQANLKKAHLQEAFLIGANLQNANLELAELQKADLADANLKETILKDANLEGVKGLQVQQLRGANVSNTKLPADIAKFEGLNTVKEASQNARKLFFSILAACVYAWLTIATTEDVDFFARTASSELPIIGTEIPMVGFYIVAPLILLAIFIYFHLQLQRLWEGLAALPAIFPDGKPLDQKTYPWLLTGMMVHAHLFHLKKEDLPFFSLQKWTTILIAWGIVPITLAWFGRQYLVKHDPLGTAVHIVLFASAVWLAISFYQNAAATLRGEQRDRFMWRHGWKDKRSGIGVIVVLVSMAIWSCLFFVPGLLPSANLVEADLRGADLRGVRLEGANLFRADLRRGRLEYARLQRANLSFARLDSVNLSEAWLQGSHLSEARLLGANLSRARLDSASLLGTRLQQANLSDAHLKGAILAGALLDSASLLGAQLQGASFSTQGTFIINGDTTSLPSDIRDLMLSPLSLMTVIPNEFHLTIQIDDASRGDTVKTQASILVGGRLNNADLSNTHLQGANLLGVQLQGTDFYGAQLQGTKVQIDQLCKAQTLYLAGLDSLLHQEVRLQCPQLLDKIPEDAKWLRETLAPYLQ